MSFDIFLGIISISLIFMILATILTLILHWHASSLERRRMEAFQKNFSVVSSNSHNTGQTSSRAISQLRQAESKKSTGTHNAVPDNEHTTI